MSSTLKINIRVRNQIKNWIERNSVVMNHLVCLKEFWVVKTLNFMDKNTLKVDIFYKYYF